MKWLAVHDNEATWVETDVHDMKCPFEKGEIRTADLVIGFDEFGGTNIIKSRHGESGYLA